MFIFITFLATAIFISPAFRKRRPVWGDELAYAALFASVPFLFLLAFSLLNRWHPTTVDLQLYHIDLALGLNPFTFMNLTYATPWLKNVLEATYYGLPILVALAWALEQSTTLVRALFVGTVIAFAFYNLVPACGPVYAINQATGQLVAWSQLADHPRNCFPSMHLGWALFVAFNARSRVWKTCAWIFVVLTAMATIGSGEHYYIDLIAAVPFCLAVQWCATHVHVLPRMKMATVRA